MCFFIDETVVGWVSGMGTASRTLSPEGTREGKGLNGLWDRNLEVS